MSGGGAFGGSGRSLKRNCKAGRRSTALAERGKNMIEGSRGEGNLGVDADGRIIKRQWW